MYGEKPKPPLGEMPSPQSMQPMQSQTPKPVAQPSIKPATVDDPNREIDLDEFDDMVADQYSIPRNLFRAMTRQESGGNVNAISPTGVRGRQQVTQKVAKMYGLNRDDPFEQSVAAGRYLREQFDALKDAPGFKDDDERWIGGLARYYNGPDAVGKDGVLSEKSIDGFSNPAEHVERVARIWGQMNNGEWKPGAAAPASSAAPVSAPTAPATPANVARRPTLETRGPVVSPQSNPFSLSQPTGFQSAIQSPELGQLLPTNQPAAKRPTQPVNKAVRPTLNELPQSNDPRFMNPWEQKLVSNEFIKGLQEQKRQAAAAERVRIEEEASRVPSMYGMGESAMRFGRGLAVDFPKTLVQAPLMANRDNLSKQVREDLARPIEEFGREEFPIDERNPASMNPLSDGFWTAENLGKIASQNLPQAAGSMLPYMAAGGIGGAAARLIGGAEAAGAALGGSRLASLATKVGINTVDDLASAVATSGLGSAQGVVSGYEAAKAAGLDEETARKSGMIEGFLGMLEGVGSPGSKGKFIKSALSNIPKEARSEAIQEMFSQLGQGLNAVYLTGYEKNKGLRDVVGESIGAGALGGVLGGAAATPGAIAGRRAEKRVGGGATPEAVAAPEVRAVPPPPAPPDATRALRPPVAPTIDPNAVRVLAPNEPQALSMQDLRAGVVQKFTIPQEDGSTTEIKALVPRGMRPELAQLRVEEALRTPAVAPATVEAQPTQPGPASTQPIPAGPTNPQASQPTAQLSPREQRNRGILSARQGANDAAVASRTAMEAGDFDGAEAALTRQRQLLSDLKTTIGRPVNPGDYTQRADIEAELRGVNNALGRVRRERAQAQRPAPAPRAPSAPAQTPSSPLLEAIANPEGGVPKIPTAPIDFTKLASRQERGQDNPLADKPILSRIRQLGGINPAGQYTGELQGALDKRYPGLINRRSGIKPDRLREMLREDGYEVGEDLDSLFKAIDSAVAGQDVRPMDRQLTTSELTGGESYSDFLRRTEPEESAGGDDVAEFLRMSAPGPSAQGPTPAPTSTRPPSAPLRAPSQRIEARQSAPLSTPAESGSQARQELTPQTEVLIESAMRGPALSGRSSTSPYSDLIENNRRAANTLMSARLDSPEGQRAIRELSSYAERRNIDPEQVENVLNYARNYQMDKARMEGRGLDPAEVSRGASTSELRDYYFRPDEAPKAKAESKPAAKPKQAARLQHERFGEVEVVGKTKSGKLVVRDAAGDQHTIQNPRTTGNQAASFLKPTEATQDDGDTTKYKFASTQVNLPQWIAEKILRFGRGIPDSALTEDGRETNPHVTVKYGLHGEDPAAVRKLLENEGPIKVTLGKISLFENEDADVVKVEVESPDLHRLNKKIADALPNSESFPEYKPHVTIAYVKPGKGKKYVGDKALDGESFTINQIAFSNKEGEQTEIQLGGKASAPAKKSPIVRLREALVAEYGSYDFRDEAERETRDREIRTTFEGMTNEEMDGVLDGIQEDLNRDVGKSFMSPSERAINIGLSKIGGDVRAGRARKKQIESRASQRAKATAQKEANEWAGSEFAEDAEDFKQEFGRYPKDMRELRRGRPVSAPLEGPNTPAESRRAASPAPERQEIKGYFLDEMEGTDVAPILSIPYHVFDRIPGLGGLGGAFVPESYIKMHWRPDETLALNPDLTVKERSNFLSQLNQALDAAKDKGLDGISIVRYDPNADYDHIGIEKHETLHVGQYAALKESGDPVYGTGKKGDNPASLHDPAWAKDNPIVLAAVNTEFGQEISAGDPNIVAMELPAYFAGGQVDLFKGEISDAQAEEYLFDYLNHIRDYRGERAFEEIAKRARLDVRTERIFNAVRATRATGGGSRQLRAPRGGVQEASRSGPQPRGSTQAASATSTEYDPAGAAGRLKALRQSANTPSFSINAAGASEMASLRKRIDRMTDESEALDELSYDLDKFAENDESFPKAALKNPLVKQIWDDATNKAKALVEEFRAAEIPSREAELARIREEGKELVGRRKLLESENERLQEQVEKLAGIDEDNYDQIDELQAKQETIDGELSTIEDRLSEIDDSEYELKEEAKALRADTKAYEKIVLRNLQFNDVEFSDYGDLSDPLGEKITAVRKDAVAQIDQKKADLQKELDEANKRYEELEELELADEIGDEDADMPLFVAAAKARLDAAKGDGSGGSIGRFLSDEGGSADLDLGAQRLADLAIVAGYRIYRSGMDFGQWARAVIKEVGNDVRPHLRAAWAALTEDTQGAVTEARERQSESLEEFGSRQAAKGVRAMELGGEVKRLQRKRDILREEARTYQQAGRAIPETLRRDFQTATRELEEARKGEARNQTLADSARADQRPIRREQIRARGDEKTVEDVRSRREVIQSKGQRVRELQARLDGQRIERDAIQADRQRMIDAGRNVPERLEKRLGQIESEIQQSRREMARNQALVDEARGKTPPAQSSKKIASGLSKAVKKQLQDIIASGEGEILFHGVRELPTEQIGLSNASEDIADPKRPKFVQGWVNIDNIDIGTENFSPQRVLFADQALSTEGLRTDVDDPLTVSPRKSADGSWVAIDGNSRLIALKLSGYKGFLPVTGFVEESANPGPGQRFFSTEPKGSRSSSGGQVLGGGLFGLGALQGMFGRKRAIPNSQGLFDWRARVAEMSNADAPANILKKLDKAVADAEAAANSGNLEDWNRFSRRAEKLARQSVQPSRRGRVFEAIGGAQTVAQLGTLGFVGRNILGHGIFGAQSAAADRLAAAIDRSISAISRTDRTIVGGPLNPWIGLREDLKNYNKGRKDALDQKRRGAAPTTSATIDIPKASTWLGEKFNDLLFYINQLPDAANYEMQYQRAYQSITEADRRAGRTTREDVERAIERAKIEADINTFRDENALSEFASGFKKLLNISTSSVTGTKNFGLGDFVFKYPKTPANLLMRSIEYSPLGLWSAARHASKAIEGVPNARRDAIQALSKAITGSASGVAMGAALAALGIIVVPDDDDLTSEILESERGNRGYSFNLSALRRVIASPVSGTFADAKKLQDGDMLVPIGWAAPWALQASVGAAIYKKASLKKAGLDTFHTLAKGLEVMGDESVFRSIGDYIDIGIRGAKKAQPGREKEAAVEAMAAKLFKDTPQSFTPGLLRSAGRVVDPFARDYRSEDRSGKFRPALEEGLRRAAAGAIPGLSQSFPTRDSIVTGEAKRTSVGDMGVLGRALAIVAPVMPNYFKDDPFVGEVLRLNAINDPEAAKERGEKGERDLSLYVAPLREKETKIKGYQEPTSQLRERENAFARAIAAKGKRLVASPAYKAANDERRMEMIGALIGEENKRTQEAVKPKISSSSSKAVPPKGALPDFLRSRNANLF